MQHTLSCAVTYFKKQSSHISQEGGLHVDEHCWTHDKPMASLSTSGPLARMEILLNIVKQCNLNYDKIK